MRVHNATGASIQLGLRSLGGGTFFHVDLPDGQVAAMTEIERVRVLEDAPVEIVVQVLVSVTPPADEDTGGGPGDATENTDGDGNLATTSQLAFHNHTAADLIFRKEPDPDPDPDTVFEAGGRRSADTAEVRLERVNGTLALVARSVVNP